MTPDPRHRRSSSDERRDPRIWRSPGKLSDLVKTILRETSRRQKPGQDGLVDAIRRAVPGPMVDYVRPQSLRGGRLVLEVSSAAVLQELSAFHRPAILQALKSDPEAPRIIDVTFKIGRWETS